MSKLLFVTDLDKTLLDDDAQVPQACLDAIGDYVKRGGLFTVSTGRPTRGVLLYPELTKLVNLPIITYNGACIYDIAGQRTLWRQVLPETLAHVLAAAIDRFPTVGLLIFRGEDDFTCAIRANDYTHEVSWNREHYRTPLRRMEDIPFPWNKAVLAGPREDVSTCAAFLREQITVPVTLVVSEGEFIELTGPDVGKGKALQRLAGLFQIPQPQIVAIGDSMNDIEMIRWAGTGVAVANSEPALKQCADFVVSSNTMYGVRECIESVVLPMLSRD